MMFKKILPLSGLVLLCLLLLAACTRQLPPERLPTPDQDTTVTTVFSPSEDTERTPSESESTTPASPISIKLNNLSPVIGRNAGSVTGAGTYLPGSEVTVTATPELLGYQFDGWYVQDQKLSAQSTYTFTAPNLSIELKAVWRPRSDIAHFTFIADTDKCIITGVINPNVTELVIPSYVTELATGAFRNCASLSAIAIPEGITHLPESLFEGCTALTDLSYSHVFQSIGRNAFLGCDSLRCSTYGNGRYLAGGSPFSWLIGMEDPTVNQCVIHPDTQFLAEGIFMGNESLRAVTFPENTFLTEIKPYTFYGCSSLERISLPEGIVTVGEQAFGKCASLEGITLPTTLRTVGKHAFLGCDELEEIRYLGSMAEWEALSPDETNRLFELTPIHCADGDSIYPIRFYGRSLLTGDDAYIYDLLEAAIMAEEPIATIPVDSAHTVDPDQCTEVFNVFLHDYPECFWAGKTLSFSVNADTDAVLSIQIHYVFEGEALTQAKNALSAVVEEILSAMPTGTPFEQTLYLHDEVAKRTVYRSNEHDQSAYGALVRGEAVCAGYAGAYQLLLQSAGYKAWSVSGDAGEPHRWNVVWLDHNTCVYTDVTWDDSETLPISHGYFNLSLSEMSEDHLPYDPSTLPTCEHDRFSYEDLTEIPTVSDEDGAEALLPLLENMENNRATIVFYYLGTDPDAWLNEALADLQAAFGWHSISASYQPIRKEIVLSLSGA